MILDEYVKTELQKFCKVAEVEKMPESEQRQIIKNYMNYLLKKGREKTRNQEYVDKVLFRNSILKCLPIKSEYGSPLEEFLDRGLEKTEMSRHYSLQYEIGKYRVDFAFPVAKVAVECDGRAYHFSDKLQIERDQKRDKYLARKGWRVIHLEGIAIRRNIDACIEKIKEAVLPYLKKEMVA